MKNQITSIKQIQVESYSKANQEKRERFTKKIPKWQRELETDIKWFVHHADERASYFPTERTTEFRSFSK